ncbi:hypothetical protein CMT22_17755 [Elizabethkingia anophelis]|nr:hypothetical protein [Elizabethkingia anophelis]
MSKTTIAIDIETKRRVEDLKHRFKAPNVNEVLYSAVSFILDNRIDISSPYKIKESKYIASEIKKYIDDTYKKLVSNDQSLRGFIGNILKDYIQPTHQNSLLIKEVFNNEFDNKNTTTSEIQQSKIEEKEPEKIEKIQVKLHNYDEDLLAKTQMELENMYRKNKILEGKLSRIFSSEKIESVGMMGKKRINIELSIEEWNELKSN